MAINDIINLDEKLSLTNRLRIAGQDYDVVVSDEVDLAINNYTNIELSLQVRDIEAELEKMPETTTADQFKNFVQSETDTMRDSALATLDIILGKGEGQRVYEAYGSSTKVLNTVIGLIQAELNKVMVERKKTADKHYSNRHKNNKKK